MKHLMMTTMLVSMLSLSPAFAQTAAPGAAGSLPQITAPEGYSLRQTQLSSDMLIGATIYDSTGEAIGEVSDLVFELANVSPGASGTDAQGGTSRGGAMTPGSPSATSSSAPQGSSVQSGTPGTDAAGNMTGRTVPGAGSNTTAVTGSDASGAAGGIQADGNNAPAGGSTSAPTSGMAGSGNTDGTAPTASGDAARGTSAPGSTGSGGMASGNETSTSGAGGGGTSATSGVVTPPSGNMGVGGTLGDGQTAMQSNQVSGSASTAEGAIADDARNATEGRITHAILDIGGFLGMGVHTVAVPVADLATYANAGDELRVYLPWSREQLEALPQYDARDPDTLGRSSRVD